MTDALTKVSVAIPAARRLPIVKCWANHSVWIEMYQMMVHKTKPTRRSPTLCFERVASNYSPSPIWTWLKYPSG